MRFETWDGKAVAGLDPETITSAHPIPDGGILLLGYDDDDLLAVIQNVMPGAAGAQAITEQNKHVAIRRLTETMGGAPAPTPPASS